MEAGLWSTATIDVQTSISDITAETASISKTCSATTIQVSIAETESTPTVPNSAETPDGWAGLCTYWADAEAASNVVEGILSICDHDA